METDKLKAFIRTNLLQVDEKMSALQSLKIECTKLIPFFSGLGIGELTTQLLEDILFADCSKIAIIASQQAKEDTKAIKSPSIRQNMLEGVERATTELKHQCLTTLRGEQKQLGKHLIVNGESIEIRPNAIEAITEENSYYLVDPREIELYALHVKAVDSINRFVEALEVTPMHIVNYFKLYPDHAELADCTYSGFFIPKN